MGLPRGSLDPGVNALVGLKESVKDGVFFRTPGWPQPRWGLSENGEL